RDPKSDYRASDLPRRVSAFSSRSGFERASGGCTAAVRGGVDQATLKTLANLFDLDRLVIDKTGVKDRFVIHLELETEPDGAPAAAAVKALQQQLGLTAVSTTH